MAEDTKREPIRRASFGLAEHNFRTFDAKVSGDMTPADLLDPGFWTNVAAQMNPGDEIRAVSDDDTWMARLYVTASIGTQVRLHLIYATEMEKPTELEANGPYFVERRKGHNWCVIERESGRIVVENQTSQSKAYREMEDLMRALAA